MTKPEDERMEWDKWILEYENKTGRPTLAGSFIRLGLALRALRNALLATLRGASHD
jgi:hypothetical protein